MGVGLGLGDADEDLTKPLAPNAANRPILEPRCFNGSSATPAATPAAAAAAAVATACGPATIDGDGDLFAVAAAVGGGVGDVGGDFIVGCLLL